MNSVESIRAVFVGACRPFGSTKDRLDGTASHGHILALTYQHDITPSVNVISSCNL